MNTYIYKPIIKRNSRVGQSNWIQTVILHAVSHIAMYMTLFRNMHLINMDITIHILIDISDDPQISKDVNI